MPDWAKSKLLKKINWDDKYWFRRRAILFIYLFFALHTCVQFFLKSQDVVLSSVHHSLPIHFKMTTQRPCNCVDVAPLFRAQVLVSIPVPHRRHEWPHGKVVNDRIASSKRQGKKSCGTQSTFSLYNVFFCLVNPRNRVSFDVRCSHVFFIYFLIGRRRMWLELLDIHLL